MTGTWLFFLTDNGVDDDPIHFVYAQTGTAVTAERSCDASWGTGTGTFAGGALDLEFDLGETLHIDGVAAGEALSGTFTIGSVSGTWRMERTSIVLDCTMACGALSPIPFVDTDFTQLSKIEEISLFRSAAGHDYSGGCEDCRSMKHYFAPKPAFLVNNDIEVYAPVDGTIINVMAEGNAASPPGINKQVRIRSSLHPEYTFILFHLDLVSTAIVAGKTVTAGEQIGWARMFDPDTGSTSHDFDIAVRIGTLYGPRYVSYFDVITPAVFANYTARGATSTTDFIITEAARDADPLTCDGETFLTTGSLADWYVLTP